MNFSISILDVVYGIIVVLPFTILMYYLLVRTLKLTEEANPLKVQNKLVMLLLTKMLISMAILLLASMKSISFMLGAFIGLLFNFFSYPSLMKKTKQK
jgi:Co/Zn/Cd efflux system component